MWVKNPIKERWQQQQSIKVLITAFPRSLQTCKQMACEGKHATGCTLVLLVATFWGAVFRPCKNDWNKQVFTQDSNHISIWTPQIFVRIPVFPLCVELESWEKMAHCGNTKALTALFTYLFSTELRSRTVSKPPPVWKHYGNKIKQLKGISLQMTGSAHASASCWWNWFNPTVA